MSSTLSSIGNQITIYCGTLILIVGIVGDLLNILVFLSLRTFRQSSCAFYLTIMSIANVCSLFFGLLPCISTFISGIDATDISLLFCKSRWYLTQICGGTSLTCWCLATIDQYFATCSRPHWQQWCNIKLAQRMIIISSTCWILHGIPYPVFYDHVFSSITNKTTCINTNYIFDQYRACFILLGLLGYIPIVIVAVFGSMAYYNVQQMTYRTVPLVRRELDRQLTVMVLVQVIVNIFTLLPYTTASAVATNGSLTSNPVIQEKLQFFLIVTFNVYYITFTSPFYIYICVSERFRRQLIYALLKVHINPCNQPRANANQV